MNKTQFSFAKAVKKDMTAAIALAGGSGAGKTWGALQMARQLVGPEGKIALVDTEGGSASLYADHFEFDTLTLQDHDPDNFTAAVNAAIAHGYSAVILDSLSHAWVGNNGVLEQVDEAKKRTKNQLSPWYEPRQKQNRLVERIVNCPIHLIATMRAKTDHVLTVDESTGKKEVKKLSNQPIQDKDMEFEFTLMLMMDRDGSFVIDKSRCHLLVPNTVYWRKDLPVVTQTFKEWLGSRHGNLIAQLSRLRTQLRNAGKEAPTIGSMSDVQAMTEEELEAQIHTHEELLAA